ncbi:hypothetical protein VTK56DRAFT_4080 [Thermocarpiscus australiensis]
MTVFSLLAVLPAALLWAAQVGAATFPVTVEVDLIFPRNDTYGPSPLFPIVFAFQNAALAPSIDPAFDLEVWDNSGQNLTGDGPALDVEWIRCMYTRSSPASTQHTASRQRRTLVVHKPLVLLRLGHEVSSQASSGSQVVSALPIFYLTLLSLLCLLSLVCRRDAIDLYVCSAVGNGRGHGRPLPVLRGSRRGFDPERALAATGLRVLPGPRQLPQPLQRVGAGPGQLDRVPQSGPGGTLPGDGLLPLLHPRPRGRR